MKFLWSSFPLYLTLLIWTLWLASCSFCVHQRVVGPVELTAWNALSNAFVLELLPPYRRLALEKQVQLEEAVNLSVKNVLYLASVANCTFKLFFYFSPSKFLFIWLQRWTYIEANKSWNCAMLYRVCIYVLWHIAIKL